MRSRDNFEYSFNLQEEKTGCFKTILLDLKMIFCTIEQQTLHLHTKKNDKKEYIRFFKEKKRKEL